MTAMQATQVIAATIAMKVIEICYVNNQFWNQQFVINMTCILAR